MKFRLLLSPFVAAFLPLPLLPAVELPAGGDSEQVLPLATELEKDLAAGGGHFVLAPRPGGGTSAYALVQTEGKTIGALIPENSATSITGEVTAWNLGRALGCAELFQPAVRVTLRGDGLAKFKQMMQGASYKGAREANRLSILARIARNPDSLPTVYKHWGASKPVDYSSIAVRGAPNGTLNTSDGIARFLRADSPQPGPKELTIRGGNAAARDLARQLSNIFLVDALCGQWDRFSGGNLHILVENGRVRFISLDNGGAAIDGSMRYAELFKSWVTRFDASIAERIGALDALASDGREFLGFKSFNEFASAVGCETSGERAGLTKRVRLVAAHVRASVSRSGGAFE